MSGSVHKAIGLLLLVCSAGSAQTESSIPYDSREWKLIKQVSATFDVHAGPANIVLLESTKPTGRDGLDQPTSDVELLIFQGGKVIYDYAEEDLKKRPELKSAGSYMDDCLETMKLTRDGPQVVLFHSGFQGASDSMTTEHIILYDKSKACFRDVAPASFYNSGIHGLRWLNLDGPDICGDRGSELYQWSGEKRTFQLYRRLYGTKSYRESGQALDGDWALIQSGLRR